MPEGCVYIMLTLLIYINCMHQPNSVSTHHLLFPFFSWIIPAVKLYRDFQKWSTIVEAAGNSAIQHSCSTYTITSFQSLRNLIQLDMFDELKLKLEGTKNATIENHDGVYAKAIALQLKNVGE